jgi:spore coat protein A
VNVVATNRRTVLGLAGGAAVGAAVVATTNLLTKGSTAIAGTDPAQGTPAVLTGGVDALTDGASAPKVTELTPFKDPLRVPPTLKPGRSGITEVRLVEKSIRLHSQLPPTPMWTYEGHYPGPTIEVRSEETVRIAWTNLLRGTSPVKGVFVPPQGPPPGLLPYNTPGSAGAPARPEVAALTAWTSVHLHGGHQFALSDGQPDSAVTYGFAQLAEYPNDEAATHLFYHDHAMPITSLNVMAGLAGNYIIRDGQEDHLNLPRGEYEIPLMIADVNFDTDAHGLINGQLLSKRVQLAPGKPGAMPEAVAFLGPYTMVNGVVWPYLDVEATAYRFRIVNRSITRSYIMGVIDESTGQPVRGAIKVIGTDMGLLGEPKPIDQVISINPAERVDIVIDFAAFAGKRLRLVNTIPGAPIGAPVPPAALQHPEVMQFRVAARKHAPYTPPAKLNADFKQLTVADVPKDAVERFVMLAFDAHGMPTLMELQEVPTSTPAGPGRVDLALPGGTRSFRTVATHFEDTTNFFSASETVQKWTFVSVDPLSRPIVHPMHIHMMDFQLLERRTVDGSGFDSNSLRTTRPVTITGSIPIAPEESGTKDTVAVPVNTMVTIGGRLGSQTGRFMYHCHIIDHEDEGMMRPHVIMPPAVLTIQNMMMTMMDDGTDPMGSMAKSSGSMPSMRH